MNNEKINGRFIGYDAEPGVLGCASKFGGPRWTWWRRWKGRCSWRLSFPWRKLGRPLWRIFMAVITVCRVIAAPQVFGENFTAMSPFSVLEPDSLRVIGRMAITILTHTMACANDGFQPAVITRKTVKTPRPAAGKKLRCRMGIGKLSPAISSFQESFFYFR